MDLLDRLLQHDAWTTRQLLVLCNELSDAQLDREFDIGHRTVRKTLWHIIDNLEIWTALMADQQGPPQDFTRTVDSWTYEMLGRLDFAASELAVVAHAVAQRDGWDERWLDTLDNPPVEKTYGGAIAHVITHSMHHRAQVLYMLKKLGLADLPEGDVLSWEQKATSI